MEIDPASHQSNDLPSELMGRTPRRVRLTGTGWFYALVWIFFLLIAGFFVVKINKAADKQKAAQTALQENGRTSLGQVTRKSVAGFAGGSVSYSFTFDGTIYNGKAKPPVDIWDGLHQGDPLPIRFLPDNPDINQPAAWEDSSLSIRWALIFPIWLAFFSFFFVWGFPTQYRVATWGIPAWACIAEREWMGPSRGQRWESYTFRNADGEVQFGRCPMEVTLKAGATVCVLYLPTNPRRSRIYPLDFFEIDK